MSVISTNITSQIAQQNLNKSASALSTAMQRLSSGMRINSAKDDAAGQAIANRMSASITGLAQAQRNANDGISVAQTTEGALNQINDNLQRIRELTVQSQNGTNSADDLTSIQNEIGQRLDEINRVSNETNFNGTKVLNANQKLDIQVGANDGEMISLNLKQINAKTLGLDGFNVDGTGVTQNRTATVTDLLAAGGSGTNTSKGVYDVKTTFKAASLSQTFANLSDGNTVAVDSDTTAAPAATTYTYHAATSSFSYSKAVGTSTPAAAATFIDDQKLLPATGTKQGTYTNNAGATTNFEVSATGAITISGQDAYWTAAGELTTNNAAGTLQGATMTNMVQITGGTAAAGVAAVADTTARSFSLNNVTYTGTASADQLSYTASISKDELSTVIDNNTGANALSTVTLGSGITQANVTFSNGSTNADTTYVDGNGDLTATSGYFTRYQVNQDSGEVTVVGNVTAVDGTITTLSDPKYQAQAGATVYLGSNGKLTTETTSKGDKTTDPLAALDTALKQVDTLRSDLGAIQNRFDSAITNLQTNQTNLSAARSRIQDADYSVEVANMTKAQILQQAGTSVLAQANQIPQSVLKLLG